MRAMQRRPLPDAPLPFMPRIAPLRIIHRRRDDLLPPGAIARRRSWQRLRDLERDTRFVFHPGMSSADILAQLTPADESATVN